MLMTWKNVNPMEQRILFIADYLKHNYSDFSALCLRYDISRKTGYKWVERYQESGEEGLHEQSRKPKHHPFATPYFMRKAIIELRQHSRIKFGPKKIQAKLKIQFPNQPPPSITTIYNILKKEGLIEPRKRSRKFSLYKIPFKTVKAANDLWSVDFKGQFLLKNGKWCYPLTIMDHYSRYLLACQGLNTTNTQSSKQVFERLFKEYGLPLRIRSDNGVPFSSQAPGGLSTLSIWWIRLGIHPERIKPGKPQQNGQHERMHLTLKNSISHDIMPSFEEQQVVLDDFIKAYNTERPHESLEQTYPKDWYLPSKREYPKQLPEITYPDYFIKRKVSFSGTIYWGNGQIYISNTLKGEIVGMQEVDNGIWDIYFGPIRLGAVDKNCVKGKNSAYWTLKV